MKINKLLAIAIAFVSSSFAYADTAGSTNLESQTIGLASTVADSEQAKQTDKNSVEKLKNRKLPEHTKKEWDQFSKNMNQEYDQLMARAEKILGKETFEKETEQSNKTTSVITSQVTNLEDSVNSSGSEFQSEDGYRIEDVTTVGLLKNEETRFKNCLIMKKYGDGAWQTYCQPLAKPNMCTSQDWRDISTMAIMYC